MITSKNSKVIVENIKKQRRATSLVYILLENEFNELVERILSIKEREEFGSLNHDIASKIIQDYEYDIESLLALQKATIIFDFENEFSNVSLSKKETNGINKIKSLLENKIKEIEKEDEDDKIDIYLELKEANIYIDLNYLSNKSLSSNLKVSEFHELNNDSIYEIILLCLKILDYKTNRFLIRKAKFNDTRFSKEEYLSKTIFFLKECTPYRNPFSSLTDFADQIDEFRKSLPNLK